MEQELIECPICNKKLKSLTSHIPFIHKMSIEEFRKRYPEIKRIQLNLVREKEIKCQYCDRVFKRMNSLQYHIKLIHPDHFKLFEYSLIDEKKLECKVCNKKFSSLYNHVLLSHHLSWEEYCKKFNWDSNTRSIFSQTHNCSLSANKKRFYKTEQGKKWKEQASEKYLGENNPAKRADVRSKISVAAALRFQKEKNRYNNYGISTSFFYNGKRYYSRSFEEFKVLYLLLKNDIDFEYERKIIKYKDENGNIRNYVLDFLINDKYIELKCDKNSINYHQIHKYKEINNILNKINKKLFIWDFDDFCNNLHLNKPEKEEPYQFLKNLLDSDMAKVTYVIGKNRKSTILKKVDENYMNHRNIFLKGEKNESIREDLFC